MSSCEWDAIGAYGIKYLVCLLDESGTDEAEYRRKVLSGKIKLQGLIGSCDVGSLQLHCARGLHEAFHVPVFMYGSETMIWREKETSRTRAAQMDNLRGFLGIKRMDKVPNARIRELCGVMKGSMKAFSGGAVIWREWRILGLPRGCM